MMALFGSVAHAPLAVMLMVAEMTGNLSMLAPAMVAVGVATFVVGDRSIYRSQLATPGRLAGPSLQVRPAASWRPCPAGGAARQPRIVLHANELVGTARARLEAAGVPGAPVLDRDGTVLGIVDVEGLATAADDTRVAAAPLITEPVLAPDDGLDEALGAMADHRRSWAPVVSRGHLAGILSVRDALAAYRTALGGNVQQVRGLRAGGIIIEAEIGSASRLAGKAVADVPWPRDAVLVAVERAEGLVVPRGDLVLAPGDRMSIFAAPVARQAVEALVGPVRVADGGAMSIDGAIVRQTISRA